MSTFSLLAGISGQAILFGFVVPAAIFAVIVLGFKLIFTLIRSIRDKRYERAYRAKKAADAAADKQKTDEPPQS